MVGSSLYIRPLIVLTLLMMASTDSLYICIGIGSEKKSSCTCAHQAVAVLLYHNEARFPAVVHARYFNVGRKWHVSMIL